MDTPVKHDKKETCKTWEKGGTSHHFRCMNKLIRVRT